MNQLTVFLPCAAGVEGFLADEVHGLTGLTGDNLLTVRAGVRVRTDWAGVLLLNLHCRLAQRVLIELAQGPYRDPEDLYALSMGVKWEGWFTPRQSFRIELTAQHSPLQSLNFATLRIKDGVADRFRQVGGERPSIDTHTPDVRLHGHLTTDTATLYIDTSGEPLFKRGWRQDKGDAPLKETLAAAMLAASGWWTPATRSVLQVPLYDPCCGSGTIVIEAAQILLGLPAGGQRRFGFEQLRPFDRVQWSTIKNEATRSATPQSGSESITVFGSDVAHRMVDFAERNAERAGVARALQLRGGDALQRMPPSEQPGVILMNPPYGERIAAAGVAGRGREAFQSGALSRARAGDSESVAEVDAGDDFFRQLSTHWKSHFAGWTAWMLTPDLKLPGKLRLKESRRVPMWNGPIECRMFRFDLTARRPPVNQEAA
ncbi:THUMP domain-containing class I SAM-dependent RNA methyltransferase [Ottowia thiooxydans]|uniref:THUMP domain-containing class I SAM-dependent RNA methyltransferase n=1 Tax=Ottowia thiooxydans TaxID=219182 RepID=UPI0004186DEB|nr:THUMP domain-containing protein [Ottowia thiooxydans]